MLQLNAVFWCCLGVVDVRGSCADLQPCGSLLILSSVVLIICYCVLYCCFLKLNIENWGGGEYLPNYPTNDILVFSRTRTGMILD
jgi:hypothetical protein